MEQTQNKNSIATKIFKYIVIMSGILLIAALCIDLSSNIYDNISPTFLDSSPDYNHIDTAGRLLASDEDYYFTTPVIEYKMKDFLSYKGNWSSPDGIEFLDDKTNGEAYIYISRYSSELDIHREKIIVKFIMLDGKYQDKKICAFSFSYVTRNDNFIYFKSTTWYLMSC